MMKKIIVPVASENYKDIGAESLDSHHGFAVEYAQKKDKNLGFHVDNAEVTLNLCLGH